VLRLAVVAAVAALFAWAIAGLLRAGPAAVVGRPAPDFRLLDPAGRPVSLAPYRGKVVLLNFWTSWCVPCQQEIPELVRFSREAGPDLVIIGVDRMEPPDVVRAFAARTGIPYPLALDRTGSVSDRYGVTGQPESFWIDRGGVLRLHVPGPMTPDQMRSTFRALEGA
jgi:cytochrome c biogenesis protein CcmG/thiol:disulfide interchange protein DsbE